MKKMGINISELFRSELEPGINVFGTLLCIISHIVCKLPFFINKNIVSNFQMHGKTHSNITHF
jgi:hypothetical protein